MVPVVEARLPPSLAVEVTVKVKVPSCAESAVTCRPDRFQVETSIGAPVLVTVFARVPSLRTTPAGTPEILVDRVSSPSLLVVSTSAVLTLSAIGESSVPVAVAPTVRLGASACSATVTVMVPVVEARLPPSLAVEVTVKVKVPSCAESAVTCRPDRFQVETSIGAPVLVTVFARVPSLRTTPAGTPEILVDRVSSPSLLVVSTSAVLTLSAIGESSVPVAVAPTVRLGASACSATVTVMVPVVEARLPPSLAVEVTVKVKVPSCAESAVTCRPDRFQVETSIGAPVLVTVFARVPSLRTTPAGTPEILVDRVSSPSLLVVSTSAVLTLSAIGESSVPVDSPIARI